MAEQKLLKKKFYDVFRFHPALGTLEPKEIVRISGVTIGPGVRFGPQITVGGINVHALKGHELAVVKDNKNGVNEIKGYYATR